MPSPRQVLTPTPERLAAAARAVTDAVDALKLAREARDELVCDAVDAGELSQRAVAAAAGITVPRVNAILAAQGNGDDD
jgi:hypothetical protein